MQYLPQHLRPKRGLDCQTFQEARDEVDRLKAEIEAYKKKTSDNDNATSPPTPASEMRSGLQDI